MPQAVTIVLVGLVVFTTHCIGTIAGFGCAVLALPFMAMLVGLKTAVPMLAVLGTLLACYVVIRSRRAIHWKALLFIAGHAAMGLPLGILLYQYLPERALMVILSGFMILIGMRGLLTGAVRRTALAADPDAAARHPLLRGVLVLGGVIHGAFAAGGPLIIIYATRALTDKNVFRATLCLLWISLNTAMLVSWTVGGTTWNLDIAVMMAAALPFLVAGVLLGDWLHHTVNERTFRLIVHSVLILSGLVILVSSVR